MRMVALILPDDTEQNNPILCLKGGIWRGPTPVFETGIDGLFSASPPGLCPGAVVGRCHD
jgi:hypothetical protein